MGMNVQISKWDLFDPLYPTQKIQVRHMEGQHVSDAIGSNEIFQWHQSKNEHPFIYGPVFISAQTGKGKNYFITHTLREHALQSHEQILYVSNRIALDYQQKKELAKLSHVQIGKPGSHTWEDQEIFGNVTVLTYQKLFSYFLEKPNEWFSRFTYVVLDECHFFYSDAFFNPHTWDILQMIPQRFKQSIRIYLSATLDDVLEPIRYHEGCETGLGQEIDEKIFLYDFPRDFSQYKFFAFSDPEQILSKISDEKNTNKWVIFVTSKAKGQGWKESLNSQAKETIAAYVDSDSRSSTDKHERVTWELLKENGSFDEKVLISTSVIDNGFSLNDNHIKNIVLFTHDRTEFLQELGRCRLRDGQKINVYFYKLSKKAQEARRKQYQQFENVIFNFCGDLIKGTSGDRTGDPAATTQNLWNIDEDSRRGFISLNDMGDGTLRPSINLMARWRTIQLGKQIAEYDALQDQFHEDAGRIYKEHWLQGNTSLPEPAKAVDLDIKKRGNEKEEMEALLAGAASAGTIFNNKSDEFNKFSKRFQELFCTIYPNDSGTNRGKNRKEWKGVAIKNRIEKMARNKDLSLAYTVQQVKKGWIIKAAEE